jgi:hypothetical protein
MTEAQKFNWVPGWKYDTKDGRKVMCLAILDNGRAVMHDTTTDGLWIVDAEGKGELVGRACDIIAGPDAPEKKLEEAEQLMAVYEQEQHQDEHDHWQDGYRDAIRDAVEVLIQTSCGMERDRVAAVVRRLMELHATPWVEPPF